MASKYRGLVITLHRLAKGADVEEVRMTLYRLGAQEAAQLLEQMARELRAESAEISAAAERARWN